MFRSKFLLPLILFFALPYAYTQMPPFGFWKTGGVRTFQILGLKGGTDATSDAWFADTGNILNIAWEDTTEDTFATTIYDNDGTTVKCATQNVAQNTTSFSFAISTDCVSGFVDGTSYKAKVVAKKGGKDYRAANSLYSFTMDTTAPTVNITSGPGANSTSSSASFVFTNSDATSGVASIECFLDAVSQGACTSPKNLTSLADGNHIFKVKVTDNAGNSTEATYNWNINTIVITGNARYYTQISTAWSQGLSVSGGSGSFTYSLPVNPGGNSAANAGPTVSYTTGATASALDFTLRVTDIISGNTKDFSFILDVYSNDLCLWTGGTSTDWATASNWLYCSGAAPIATSKVAILSTAANMPIVAVNATVDSFGSGPGGGTVTVNSGRSLTLTNSTQTFRSDVKVKGATTTCTNCNILNSNGWAIVDGKTLELQSGIRISVSSATSLRVGDGATHGILKLAGGATLAEWPQISAPSSSATKIRVQGTSSNKSVIDISGLYATPNNMDSGSLFYFEDYYEIRGMDHVAIASSGQVIGGNAFFRFASCTNASILDTAWDDISLNPSMNTTGYNVRADGTNCSGLSVITLSAAAGTNGGSSYGPQYELDPNNKINWANSSTLSCVWTGAVDTNWETAGNWNSCNNSRANYPDQMDWAIIPVTPNQPMVSNNLTILGIAAGTGGGSVTIASGKTLTMTNVGNTVQSNISFKGATTTCTTCIVKSINDMSIVNDSTLTLLTGIKLDATGKGIYIGDGTTGGKLATGAAGAANELPQLTTSGNGLASIIFNGASGHLAGLNIDGLILTAGNLQSAKGGLDFQNWYQIQKFDNVTIATGNSNYVPSQSGSYIRFKDCTNGSLLDTNWDGFTISGIPLSTGHNVDVDTATCGAMPAVTITQPIGTVGGSAYGPLFEQDAVNKIAWSNIAMSNCTWTGASSTSWTNPANWNTCTNGRANYPDQFDTALVPITGNQPTISSDIELGYFRNGTGGGTVTINSGISLTLYSDTQTFSSDIKLQGQTTTCTNCTLATARTSMTIVNDATLTLLKGISVEVRSKYLYVGNGSTGGTLATGPAGTAAEFPRIVSSNSAGRPIRLNGASGHLAAVNFDGINITTGGVQSGSKGQIEFEDWYSIQKFDNVTIASGHSTYLPANGGSYIYFKNCTNATVTDTGWSALSMTGVPTGTGYNIRADGTSCSSLPTISLTGYSGTGACGAVGAGACAFENDPNSKIDWN